MRDINYTKRGVMGALLLRVVVGQSNCNAISISTSTGEALGSFQLGIFGAQQTWGLGA